MRKKNKVNAAILIIGNEILSVRTQYKNVAFLSSWLNTNCGITVSEVRIIPDVEKIIIKNVRLLSKEFNYELVHMNIMHPGIWQALYLKWKYKKPYIVSENWHGFQNINEQKISFFQRHLIKLGFKHAFSICPVSNQLKEDKTQGSW